jgi:hypothetical protein
MHFGVISGAAAALTLAMLFAAWLCMECGRVRRDLDSLVKKSI